MTAAEIEALRAASRYRVALLDGEVPPELRLIWDRLFGYMIDGGVGAIEAQARLAMWLTDYVPALRGVPSLIVLHSGPAGVAQVERVFTDHDAYFWGVVGWTNIVGVRDRLYLPNIFSFYWVINVYASAIPPTRVGIPHPVR